MCAMHVLTFFVTPWLELTISHTECSSSNAQVFGVNLVANCICHTNSPHKSKNVSFLQENLKHGETQVMLIRISTEAPLLPDDGFAFPWNTPPKVLSLWGAVLALCSVTLPTYAAKSSTTGTRPHTLVTAANDLQARDATTHQHQTHFTGPTSALIITFLPCLFSVGIANPTFICLCWMIRRK